MPHEVILVVEDQKSMALYLQERLQQVCDLPVLACYSYSEAKALLEAGTKVLVCVSDLHLPDAMDGEAVALMQKHHVTTVVLTASYSDETRREMFKAHVADYVIKDGQASIDYAVNTVVKLVGNDKRRVWLLASPNGVANKLVGLLKIHRYPVCVFDDFKALNAALSRETPDLLLLEGVEEIPKGDVFTFINGLRSRYTANQLPVIVCGSTAELPVAIKLMKYGVNDFYNTGFSAEELYVRLNQNLEQAEAYQRIERISQTDALTRLYNRGYFFQTGQSQLEGWQKQKLPAFVVMSDIDHFKSVNDTHGHQKGDEAITFVADQLQKTFKDHLVARFGGEEFCVLGVVDEPEALQGACEQFRHAIETGSENEIGVPFTASVGVARVDSHLEQAIYDADQALYQAKASGRNRVVVTPGF